MLEYFTYKKVKKHKAAKKAKEEEEAQKNGATEASTIDEQPKRTDTRTSSSSEAPPLPKRPVLDRSDESFIQNLLAEKDGPTPNVPDEVKVPELDWPASDDASMRSKEITESSKDKKKEDKGKGKEKDKEEKEKKKGNRLSFFFNKKKHGDTLKPEAAAAPTAEDEEEREEKDLDRVLDRLNLSAKNNKVFSLSEESADLLTRFTQVFKDLANGVPTAYDDLVKLITDRDGAINRGFEKLPSSLQKLVTQLPEKLTGSLAPELLAAAAKSQGIEAAAEGGMKATAANMFKPQALFELLTKPGALVGMLRAIVSALQSRWPAFIGVNVIWSVALFLLMFVLWYCHKRGREVRLEQEKAEGEEPVDGSSRVEELPDDPLLPEPHPETTRFAAANDEPALAESSTAGAQREPATTSAPQS